MRRRYYPALVVTDRGQTPEDGYGIVFPDFPGCVTEGDTVCDALEHAVEALSLHVSGMQDKSLPIPDPTGIQRPDWFPQEVIIMRSSLISVDVQCPHAETE